MVLPERPSNSDRQREGNYAKGDYNTQMLALPGRSYFDGLSVVRKILILRRALGKQHAEI